MKMNIVNIIAGILVCAIGSILWYIDYVIFKAIGALTLWIAELAGITGAAVLGVQIIGWILTASIMICLFAFGALAIAIGLGIMVDE
jgi:hypothetical protein